MKLRYIYQNNWVQVMLSLWNTWWRYMYIYASEFCKWNIACLNRRGTISRHSLVSQRSWVWIPFRPDFFLFCKLCSQLLTCSCSCDAISRLYTGSCSDFQSDKIVKDSLQIIACHIQLLWEGAFYTLNPLMLLKPKCNPSIIFDTLIQSSWCSWPASIWSIHGEGHECFSYTTLIGCFSVNSQAISDFCLVTPKLSHCPSTSKSDLEQSRSLYTNIDQYLY